MKNKLNLSQKLIIIAVILAVLVPIMPIIIWSFSKSWVYPDLLPEFSLRAWKQVFTTKSIISAFGTSLFLGIACTIISFIIALPAARALAVYKFKSKSIVYGFLILPAIIPSITSIMGLQIVFIHLNLINTFLGVLLAHLIPTLPYMIMYLKSTYESFDVNFENQAMVLGAGPIKRFFYVTLPLMRSGIVVASLYTFLVSWSQYLVSIIIGGPHIKTLPTSLFSYLTSGDQSMSAAVSIVFVLPSLVMLIFSSKYLSGITVTKE